MADSSQTTPEIVDVEGREVGTELTISPPAPPPATLFRTDDPVLVLKRATEVADALKDVIVKRNLYKNISGKSHVLVEGWLTLGSMLGVTAVCEWTRPIEDGWEARVVAQTLDGRTIGAAESMCVGAEGKPWDKADDHARRSMAQTRATSKALASVLRFVVTLAGYEGTPAEEATARPAATAAAPESEVALDGQLDPARVEQLITGIKALGLSYRQIDLLLGAAGVDGLRARSAKAVQERLSGLTDEQASAVEMELEKEASRAS